MFVYRLTLTEGRYYVGRTTDPKRRYAEHKSGEGSNWTRLYPPIKMEIIQADADAFDEDKYVKITMAQHGIDMVRGGQYVRVNLTPAEKHVLYKEIKNATDRCFRCGKNGHYAADCTSKQVIDINTASKQRLTQRCCSYCRKPGHTRPKCPML